MLPLLLLAACESDPVSNPGGTTTDAMPTSQGGSTSGSAETTSAAASTSQTTGPTDDAETSTTEDASTSSGSPGGSDTGAMGALPLPSPFHGELEGDYYVPAGTVVEVVFEDPDTPTWNTIHGSLRIETGAELRMHASLRVEGAVDCEADTQVLSSPYGFTFRADALAIQGSTRAASTWTGVFTDVQSASIEWAHLDGGRMHIDSGPSQLLDSTVDEAFVILHGDGVESSRIEYNTFRGIQLYASAASVQYNDIAYHDGSNNTLAFTVNADVSWPNIVCEGELDVAQDFVFTNNVLGPVAENAPHVTVDRDYGAVDLSGNYFQEGLPSWDSINDWEGVTAPCGGTGSFGGPATVEPLLDAPPPVYGPRR